MQLSSRIAAGPPERGRNTEEQVRELRDYLRLLIQELDVLLKNLDEGNVNPKALERLRGE